MKLRLVLDIETNPVHYYSASIMILYKQERIISRVSMDKRTVELDRALNFTHHGITETMSDGNFIEIRLAK